VTPDIMKRTPNPWIVIPSVVLGLLAGLLGWVVTEVSCRQPDSAGQLSSCSGWAFAVAAVAFVAVTVGVTLVLVLVYRSLAEWRERTK
jgi:hypothetical protein